MDINLDMQHILVPVHSAWIWICRMSKSMLHGSSPYCLSVSMLHVHVCDVCPCCITVAILHVHAHAACLCLRCFYISMLHVHVHDEQRQWHGHTHTDMNMKHGHGRAACTCPMSMPHYHGHTVGSWLCFMLYDHVHAACPCPFSIFMFMLFVYVHAACPCPWWTWTLARTQDTYVNMQHGLKHETWTWTHSMDNRHSERIWTCIMGMNLDMQHILYLVMQHGHVYAVFPSPYYVSTSMLRVHVHTTSPWPCCMACPCCMSMSILFTVGVTNRCLYIVVHIFSLVLAMPLRPVGLGRGVFLDAVGEVAQSWDKNFLFGGHLKECVSIALIPVNR
jgi:hypothetical protein